MENMNTNISNGLVKNKKKAITLFISTFLFLGAVAPGCPFGGASAVPKDGGVFKSQDGGLTWQAKNNLIPPEGSKATAMDISSLNILSIGVDPADDNIVYAGSDSNGLFRTTDAGENWEIYNGQNLRANETIYDIAIDIKDSKNIYIAGVTAANKGRLLKSTDAGANWEETYVTLASADLVNKIRIDNYNTSIVYIGTSSGAVLQSTDYGRSWVLMGAGRFAGGINNFLINPRDTRILYITSLQEGLLKSTDKGVTWTSLVEKLKTKELAKFAIEPNTKIDILAIDPKNPDTVYLGFINGMLKTTDGGQTWVPINIITPPAVLPIVSLVVDPNDSRNIYYGINSQIYLSNTAGTDWFVRNLPTSRVLQIITIDPKNTKTIYAGSKLIRNR